MLVDKSIGRAFYGVDDLDALKPHILYSLVLLQMELIKVRIKGDLTIHLLVFCRLRHPLIHGLLDEFTHIVAHHIAE